MPPVNLLRGKTREDAQHVSEWAQALESAIRDCGDVGGEAHAHDIDGVSRAAFVLEHHDVARAAATFDNRAGGVLRSAVKEIAQKRISRSDRQEAERGPFATDRIRQQTIHDFVCGAVAAHGDEVAPARGVGLARELRRVACTRSVVLLDFQARGAQPFECRGRVLARAATASGGIHDREKFLLCSVHTGTTSSRVCERPISSASTLRLILSDAVLGKSWSKTR